MEWAISIQKHNHHHPPEYRISWSFFCWWLRKQRQHHWDEKLMKHLPDYCDEKQMNYLNDKILKIQQWRQWLQQSIICDHIDFNFLMRLGVCGYWNMLCYLDIFETYHWLVNYVAVRLLENHVCFWDLLIYFFNNLCIILVISSYI